MELNLKQRYLAAGIATLAIIVGGTGAAVAIGGHGVSTTFSGPDRADHPHSLSLVVVDGDEAAE